MWTLIYATVHIRGFTSGMWVSWFTSAIGLPGRLGHMQLAEAVTPLTVTATGSSVVWQRRDIILPSSWAIQTGPLGYRTHFRFSVGHRNGAFV